ncbi:MAG: D-alanyl-D-alanine carboxypeptidase/D-alanyl-D-alanine endopeptidase [Frankiaceae bacterium]
MRRRPARGLLIVVAALALAFGCLVTQPAPAAGRSAGPVAAGLDEQAGPAGLAGLAGPPQLDVGAPLPSAARLTAVLTPLLSSPALGGLPGALVVDARSGTVLLDLRGHDPMAPASTAKLIVGAGALLVLGPDARIDTKVVQAPDGSLYLVGGGDTTLTTGLAGSPAKARLQDLATGVARAVARPVPRVLVDTSLFTGPELAPGWKTGYVTEGNVAPVQALQVDGGRLRPGVGNAPRSPDPAIAAGGNFVRMLGSAGVTVASPQITRGVAPPGSPVVATVTSPPMRDLVEQMLTDSENNLAEALGRLVAIKLGLPASFRGAADANVRVLGMLGIPTDGLVLSDVTGLSVEDRISPATLLAVLGAANAAEHPELRPLFAGLPIAGLTGTLDERFRTVPTRAGAGVVRAKTGHLDSVGALAGQVVDVDGRLLLFAVLAPTPTIKPGEEALDRVAASLAVCGCR